MRIHDAAELVEILGRPVFAVHTEMPECAASFFAVSGLRGHTNFYLPFKEFAVTPKIAASFPSLRRIDLTGFIIEFIGRAAEILVPKLLEA